MDGAAGERAATIRSMDSAASLNVISGGESNAGAASSAMQCR